jgi:tetratricopeptide (TPR) repeat protein
MEWYRRKSWTKDDETEFFQKLARARKERRAQYLKIQALELIETNDIALVNIAETLLLKLLNDYPEDKLERSSALHTLGNIYRLRQNFDKSISYYKQAIEFENIFPNVQTNAYLDLSELIVKSKKLDLYDLAEKSILERVNGLAFPLDKYKAYSILSIINRYKNNDSDAKYYANLADKNADLTSSGFQYHKNLGIVTERDEYLDNLVKN